MHDLIAFCKWCQNLPLPELAANLKRLGFDGVDLPCRPGAPVTHANGPEKLPEAKKIFEDHGLRLERLVTSLSEADADTERLLETVHEIGVRKIRLEGYGFGGPYKGKTPREVLAIAQKKVAGLARLFEKHQVAGAIQNHSGSSLAVNLSCCLLTLADCSPEWTGVQYDPGHCALSGEPPEMAVGLLGPYLHSVNFKSPRQEYFVDPKTGRLSYKPVWVPIRDGMLDVPAVLKALAEAGYTDPISIHAEYRNHFYRVENDMEATNGLVADDVEYLRGVMRDTAG